VIVDCDRCEVRGLACDDCVITVMLGTRPHHELGDDECRAVDALAESGLVPPLRYRTPGSAAG